GGVDRVGDVDPDRVRGPVVRHGDREGVRGGAGVDRGGLEGLVDHQGDRARDRDRGRVVDRGGAGGRGGGGVGHRARGDRGGHRVGHGDRLGGPVGQVERAVVRLGGGGRGDTLFPCAALFRSGGVDRVGDVDPDRVRGPVVR